MHMIDLDGNQIKLLPTNGLRVTTDQLSLANNQLESISALAFNGSLIGTIQLNGNLRLSHVDQLAFKGLGGLRKLDMSDTALTSLPTNGLEDIEQLFIKRTASLRTFPSVYHFRSIQEAHLTYPYHCCAFNFPDIQDPEEHRRYQEWAEKLRKLTNCSRESVTLSAGGAGGPAVSGGIFHSAVSEETSHLVCDSDQTSRLRSVVCSPTPDAFNPCEDIMGYKTLRVAVWLVVVTAVVGNVVVLVVLINRSFKLTTPKFLMCNLAFADLCMGLYLLIIASMDVHTIGVYFSFAIDWQEGLGCQVAGFLTVFASELSVFTLVTITCERWYAITNAIYLTKRLRITGAVRVMAVGWLYSAVMAAFPLVGIGSYSKTSICLPVVQDGQDQAGIAFLLFLLLGNCLAFLLISWFYLRMYCSISTVERGLVRPNDLKVAKRMALLVFTDFACWAPITFFGVTAIIGFPLINVTNSKILLVFFYPINSCANPYLYAIFTKQFRQEFFLMLGRRGLCRRQALRFRAAGTLSRNDLLKLSNGSRSTQPRSGQTLLEMSSMRCRKLSAESGGALSEGRSASGAAPERKPSGRRDCRLSPVLEASRTAEASVATVPAHQTLLPAADPNSAPT
ncbi:lutropin-choriogonadotropic hormone receptor-like [Amphibalanus amphitrite]|uniref:lutropin-choriogonadotropic hormone receptor-like n=1 Tax=Amphibalanus amphitrite TaxID=1232801 RepID=UPI001C925EE3|nr:lutropin-choriogonadotropic hormone receptor-like [Amphibalanus amphitrite]